jgi:phytoene synthase
MQSESAVDASYEHCRQIAKQAESSFYRSFSLLQRPKRRAMWALYAFLRHTDDLSDSDTNADREARSATLGNWRRSLERATAGEFDDPLLPALKDVIDRHEIPLEYLTAVIDGMEMDLGPCRYETFDDLKLYCYRVASVVGLACIHIWGFRDRAAIQPAVDCGIAFQLTNILRDLKEDAGRDRIYLPQQDFDQFGYSVEDLRNGVCDDRFQQLMTFEIERAEGFYRAASPLTSYLDGDGRRILRAMVSTYHALLHEIRRAGGNVLRGRVRISRMRKFWFAASAILSGRLTSPRS